MRCTILIWLLALFVKDGSCKRPPNIVVIVADDLGWNDVGFHGSNQVPTPNIDALAYSGIILNSYYVDPICTPSRSALMTGYHPIHTGLQSGVLVGAAPYALPLRFRLLPEYLASDFNHSCHLVGKWHLGSHRAVYTPTKRGFESHVGYWTGHEDYYDHTAQELYGPVVRKFGGMHHGVIRAATPYGVPLRFKFMPEYLTSAFNYSSHMVGKWHLGHFRSQYLPMSRGFQSHFGYWTGKEDYFQHTNLESRKDGWGYDFRRGMNVSWSDFGTYATDLFTDEAEKIISAHRYSTRPLFLYLAHLAVHSGNTYAPLQAPEEVIAKFGYIKDKQRRTFAAMLHKLDESVGRVVSSLQDNGLLENSVIVFTTDNGGPAAGFNQNAASNWPLRGVKSTLWEGGVRGSALLWSPMLKKRSRVAKQMMNVQDWLPTLYSAAGGKVSKLPQMDGMDMWSALSEDKKSPRNLMLHNVDEGRHIAALRVAEWKYLRGSSYNGQWDGWYGPSGREDPALEYNVSAVRESPAARAVEEVGLALPASDEEILQLRHATDVKCGKMDKGVTPCHATQSVCLFNIEEDPCEKNNLAFKLPDAVRMMEETLKTFQSTAVPPGNKPIDPRANPIFFDYTWTNWLDYYEPLNGTDDEFENAQSLHIFDSDIQEFVFKSRRYADILGTGLPPPKKPIAPPLENPLPEVGIIN